VTLALHVLGLGALVVGILLVLIHGLGRDAAAQHARSVDLHGENQRLRREVARLKAAGRDFANGAADAAAVFDFVELPDLADDDELDVAGSLPSLGEPEDACD